MMHDLGLTERYMADARFEIDGADAAAGILGARDYPEAKIDIVWEAIALHASMEIAARRCPEVALVHIGTFMDGKRPVKAVLDTRAAWAQARPAVTQRPGCGAPRSGRSPAAGRSPSDSSAQP